MDGADLHQKCRRRGILSVHLHPIVSDGPRLEIHATELGVFVSTLEDRASRQVNKPVVLENALVLPRGEDAGVAGTPLLPLGSNQTSGLGNFAGGLELPLCALQYAQACS